MLKHNKSYDRISFKKSTPTKLTSLAQFDSEQVVDISSDDIDAARSDDGFDEEIEFRVSDLSKKKPDVEVISLDDTIEESSDFSFTVHEPLKKKLKPLPSNIASTSDIRSASNTESSDVKTMGLSRQDLMKEISKKHDPAQLKEANKVTKKREELMKEMVICLPSTLHDRLSEAELLQEQELEMEARVDVQTHYPIIQWKRKVTAKYDSVHDIFLPCSPQEIFESCKVIYYQAEEFFQIITSIDLDNESQVTREIPFDGNTIVMIEGCSQYLTKIQNLENKVFKQKVLDNKQKPVEINFTVKDLEYLINKLQYTYSINVYPVKNLIDTRDWLTSFTYTLAFGMYDKLERNPELANLIHIKSGTDYKSTFIETIHKFKLMPYTRCERLFLYYDSLQKISDRYKTNNTLGKDKDGKTLVSESTETGMRNFFNSCDPNEIIYN